MALFDFLNGNKKKVLAEQKIEEQKQEQHDQAIQRQAEEHKDFTWPDLMPLNLFVRKPEEKPHLTVVNGGENASLETEEAENTTADEQAAPQEKPRATVQIDDPLTKERKDEIGKLIYEPELKPEMLKDLSLQEILFLEVAMVTANRMKALENYEQNHQKIRNQFLNMVRAAEKLYIIYDARTGYPLLDGGYVQMYLDEEHANIAAKLYDDQLRKTRVIAVPGMSAKTELIEGKEQLKIFDFMYFLGFENVIVDNGWYKGFLRRSEISAPFYINEDPEKIPPYNPALSFALIDYVAEVKWPVNYGKRQDILKAKFNRIMQLVPKSNFIVPLRSIDEASEEAPDMSESESTAKPADVPENTAAAQQSTEDADTVAAEAQKKNRRIQLPVVQINGKNMLPVYTDIFEYSKEFGKSTFKPIRADFKGINRFIANYNGMVINPQGAGMVIERRPGAQAPNGQPAAKADAPTASIKTAPKPQADSSNVIDLSARRK